MRISTRKLAICGLLTAIGIVLKLYLANTPLVIFGTQFKIPFAYMVTYVAGFVGGPILGFISGVLIDLLGTLLTGQSPIFGLSLTIGLAGALAGLAYKIPHYGWVKYPLIVGTVTVGQLLCSVVLNSYILYLYGIIGKGKAFSVTLAARIIPQMISIPFVIIAVIAIMEAYEGLNRRLSH